MNEERAGSTTALPVLLLSIVASQRSYGRRCRICTVRNGSSDKAPLLEKAAQIVVGVRFQLQRSVSGSARRRAPLEPPSSLSQLLIDNSVSWNYPWIEIAGGQVQAAGAVVILRPRAAESDWGPPVRVS
jgi:hypothetical protein